MAPIAPRPSPEQQPPRGVPRWLWPPPGAAVDGGPLGAPSADGARGILWRYIEATVGL